MPFPRSPRFFRRFVLLLVVCVIASACGSSGETTEDSTTSDSTATDTQSEESETGEEETEDGGTESSGAPNAAWLDEWIVNTDGETSTTIGDSPVNVQSAEIVEVDGEFFMQIASTNIPNYRYTLSEFDVERLESRQFYDTDFGDDGLLAGAGDEVVFGQDIGYISRCDGEENAGAGFWPPGPDCPTEQQSEILFTLTPELAAEEDKVATGAGNIGLWVNGVSIYNWGDTTNVNGWQRLAPVSEANDLDVCPGHSARGDYHHHSNPICLGAALGDVGDGHSPIYGFASDGFPIHGPWVADGVLARSSWVVRGLDDPNDPTGCGEAGARTCFMVDQLDPSAGVVAADQPGLTTSDEDTTLSGNVFQTVAGYFMEDYYYDASLNDGSIEGLDQHGGHDHDGLGYHYHTTVADDGDGNLLDAFPYYIGISFAGVIGDHAAGGAAGDAGGPPGDGQGPPPDGEGPPPGE